MMHKEIIQRGAWALLGALVMLASPADARAQDDIDGPLKEQLQEYWSVERELPVIQDKLYSREGKIDIGLYTGLMSSDPFFWYLPVGGRVAYFLSEGFAVEVGGQYAIASDTELTGFLRDDRGDAFKEELHTGDKFSWRANAVAKWHPIYGKWALLQRKLSHFDFNLVAGLGAVGYRRPDANRLTSSTGVGLDVIFGGGFSFFVTEDITVRLDGRGYLYLGPEFQTSESFQEQSGFLGRLALPTEFLLGVSYAL